MQLKTCNPYLIFWLQGDLGLWRLLLTSYWRADQVRDGMQEVDKTQGRGEVGGAHDIRGHHRDECYVRPIKVAVEYRKQGLEGEWAKEREWQTAEAFKSDCWQVAKHPIPLQTPREKEICQYWAEHIHKKRHHTHSGLYLRPVRDPSKGDVTYNAAHSKYGHEESGLFVLNPRTECIRNQINHRRAAASCHKQEGNRKNQEVGH